MASNKGVGSSLCLFEFFGNSEVDDPGFKSGVVNDDICWFDVPVKDQVGLRFGGLPVYDFSFVDFLKSFKTG